MIGQILATPSQFRLIWTNIPPPNFHSLIPLAIPTILAGIWNLDFFRFAYPQFCLHPSLSTLEMFALDYIIAFYPMGLVVVTYMFCELRYRFPALVRCCRPIYCLFARFRRELDVRKSLINSFATFLLLSYVKILNITFDLLVFVRVFDENGNVLRKVLYYDASIKYFGLQHFPYAIFALFVSIIFNILPLLLVLVYPCQFFQGILNRFRFRFLCLHTFMDTFLGCYKLRPTDYRYFAAVYITMRLLNLFLFFATQIGIYFPLMAIVFLTLAVCVSKMQPYSNQVYNNVDTLLMLCAGFAYMMQPVYLLARKLNQKYLQVAVWFAFCFLGFYFLYGIGLMIYSLLPKVLIQKLQSFAQNLKTCIRNCKRYQHLENVNEAEYEEETAELCQLQEDEYTPLI